MTDTRRWARLVGTVALVASGLVLVMTQNGPASAAAATKLTLGGFDTAVVKNEPNAFKVFAKDTDNNTDATYTGAISWTATAGANNCAEGPCFEVRAEPEGDAIASYTFAGADGGEKQLYVIWKTVGSDRSFTVSGPVTGGDGTDSVTRTGITVANSGGGTTTTTTPGTTTTTVPGTTTTTVPGATTTTAPATTTTTVNPCAKPNQSLATISKNPVAPGETITLSGQCFAANTTLTVTFYSPARVLGTTTSDAQGRFATIFPIPSDATPGAHALDAQGPGGQGGNHQAFVEFTVSGQAVTTTTVAGQTTTTGASNTTVTTSAPVSTTRATVAPVSTLARTGAESSNGILVGGALFIIGLVLVTVRGKRPEGQHF